MPNQLFRAFPTTFSRPRELFNNGMGSGRVAIPIHPNFKRAKPVIDKECLDIMAWLSPLDFLKKQNDVFVKHQEGTGEWILDSKEFNDWLLGSGTTLWCPGIRTFTLDNLRRMRHD